MDEFRSSLANAGFDIANLGQLLADSVPQSHRPEDPEIPLTRKKKGRAIGVQDHQYSARPQSEAEAQSRKSLSRASSATDPVPKVAPVPREEVEKWKSLKTVDAMYVQKLQADQNQPRPVRSSNNNGRKDFLDTQ